jgi:hypothetical protein
MHLTPYQKRQLKIVIALVLGIPLTIYAVYQGVQYLSRASTEAIPKDVVVTNLTTNSLTVTWFTEVPAEGYIVPVLNGVEQSPVRDRRGSGKRNSHYVELKSLEPNTKYSFVIVSGNNRYSNDNGLDYEFTTAPAIVETPIPNPAHGPISGVSNDDVIVYISLKNKSAYPVSTTIPKGGNWLVDLSSLRKISDKKLLRITDDTELVLMAKNTVGRGSILEGTYSALFDSNGKLNQTLSLQIGDVSDLISSLPDEAKLGVVATTPPTNNPPVVTPPTSEDQEPEEEEDDDLPIDTNYVIVHDLKWLDMTTEGNFSSLDSGEDTIVVTNLTDVGFNVVWRSSEKVDGYIKYGTSPTSLTEEVWDIRDGLSSRDTYYSHSVETKRLDSETEYFFEVYSGNQKYNNGGQMYSVKTYPILSTPPPFETKSGAIVNTSTPGDWILIAKILDDDEMGTSGSSGYVSTIPYDNGDWILTIGGVRSEDGSTYFSFSNSDILSMYLVGDSNKLFDFPMSRSDISVDASTLGSTSSTNSVKLLSDYGIVNIK